MSKKIINLDQTLHLLQKLTQKNDRPKCINAKLQNFQNIAGENLGVLGFGNEFLNMTPKAQLVKEKIDMLHFIKIKNFPVKNVNTIRQVMHWEEIFSK